MYMYVFNIRMDVISDIWKMITIRWGGDLTPLGKEQAELLDAQFRHNMYPDTEGVRLYVCMYVCMYVMYYVYYVYKCV